MTLLDLDQYLKKLCVVSLRIHHDDHGYSVTARTKDGHTFATYTHASLDAAVGRVVWYIQRASINADTTDDRNARLP